VSVINKMLRDLDQRDAPPDAPQRRTGVPLRSGTVSVPGSVGSPKVPSYGRWAVVLLGGAALVGALYVWSRSSVPTASLSQDVNVSAAVPVPVPVASVPVGAQAKPPAPAIPFVKDRKAAIVQKPLPVTKPTALAVMEAPPAATPAQAASSTPLSASQAVTAPIRTASAAAGAVAGASTPRDGGAAAPRQQQAWRDALAQAQQLWAGGSHDGAVELLQQAVDTAARAAPILEAGQEPAVMLVTLVREYARMQLADGRAAAVYALLRRLAPQLGGDADILALRGNVAQRLGHHQESIDAYMKALQSRPQEQRWLLGAAVSQAALGAPDRASELAQRARAVGPISKDIQAYLLQMGVRVREP